jgi:hypothetical protein
MGLLGRAPPYSKISLHAHEVAHERKNPEAPCGISGLFEVVETATKKKFQQLT